MPKKKSGFSRLTNFEGPSLLSGSKSYTGLLYGVITVIVLFVIIFLGLRAISQRGGDVPDDAGRTEKQTTYTVREGDSLWTIAEQVYKDGYQWTKIAEQNKISNPDAIETGTKLVIPSAPEITAATITLSPTPADDGKITGSSYTVLEGDNLWTISIRAYGDGYKWPEIARINNIPNADLIYPGNEIKLPR